MTHVTSAIIVGGGIGGAATALSLARQGIKVMLLEKAHEIGEIGAGIQLGPNAFSALDSLGVGDVARQRAVFTDHITMMDAVNAEEVVCIETGQAFRDHFGGPYAVIHRVDIHATVWEAVLTHPGVEYRTSTHIVDIRQTPDDVTVFDEQGNSWTADILVGCDGVKSVVRQSLLGDAPRVTGHVVYRAVIDCDDMPDDLRINAPVLWAGPHCHLVHYPLRGGQQYNLVVTFHSRQQEEWGVKDGSKEEVLSYFAGIHPARARCWISRPPGAAGRPPIASRSRNGEPSVSLWWATPRIRWRNIWPRAPVWRWKTPSRWAKRWNAATATRSRHLRCMSRCVFPARRVSSGLPARWDVSITPPGWSVRCVICCGKGNRRRRFIAVSNGCTAGKKITVLSRVERLT